MSDFHDDHDYGHEVELEREAEYQREMAIAHHMAEQEADDYERRRRQR